VTFRKQSGEATTEMEALAGREAGSINADY